MIQFNRISSGAQFSANTVKELFVDREGKEVKRDVRFDLFGEYLGTSKLFQKKNWQIDLLEKVRYLQKKYTSVLENLKQLEEGLVKERSEAEARELSEKVDSMTDEQLAQLSEALEQARQKRRAS